MSNGRCYSYILWSGPIFGTGEAMNFQLNTKIDHGSHNKLSPKGTCSGSRYFIFINKS